MGVLWYFCMSFKVLLIFNISKMYIASVSPVIGFFTPQYLNKTCVGTCLPSVGAVTGLSYRVSVQKHTQEVEPNVFQQQSWAWGRLEGPSHGHENPAQLGEEFINCCVIACYSNSYCKQCPVLIWNASCWLRSPITNKLLVVSEFGLTEWSAVRVTPRHMTKFRYCTLVL